MKRTPSLGGAEEALYDGSLLIKPGGTANQRNSILSHSWIWWVKRPLRNNSLRTEIQPVHIFIHLFQPEQNIANFTSLSVLRKFSSLWLIFLSFSLFLGCLQDSLQSMTICHLKSAKSKRCWFKKKLHGEVKHFLHPWLYVDVKGKHFKTEELFAHRAVSKSFLSIWPRLMTHTTGNSQSERLSSI